MHSDPCRVPNSRHIPELRHSPAQSDDEAVSLLDVHQKAVSTCVSDVLLFTVISITFANKPIIFLGLEHTRICMSCNVYDATNKWYTDQHIY